MKCIKCDNELEASVKVCGKCGAEQIKSPAKPGEAKSEQKSFKLDMSKEGNRRSLMGIGFLILLKLLGPLVGSYLLAGIILGVLFAIIDYSYKKLLTKTGKIDATENSKEKNSNNLFVAFSKYAPLVAIIILIGIIGALIFSKNSSKEVGSIQSGQENKEFLFNKQVECMRICQGVYENHKKTLLTIGTLFEPRYAYNKDKNACFYSGGWVDSTASNTKLVVNCQTNEEVLTFETDKNGRIIRNCETCVTGAEEYDRRENEFMGSAK